MHPLMELRSLLQLFILSGGVSWSLLGCVAALFPSIDSLQACRVTIPPMDTMAFQSPSYEGTVRYTLSLDVFSDIALLETCRARLERR